MSFAPPKEGDIRSVLRKRVVAHPEAVLGKTLSVDGVGVPKPEAYRELREIMESYRDRRVETFRYFLLDSDGRIRAHIAINSGHPAKVVVAPGADREEAKGPLGRLRDQARAWQGSIICVHNHPTGDPTPSKEDKEITTWLRQPDVLGDQYGGHVIVNHGTFWVHDPWSKDTTPDNDGWYGSIWTPDVNKHDDVLVKKGLPGWALAITKPEELYPLREYRAKVGQIALFHADRDGQVLALEVVQPARCGDGFVDHLQSVGNMVGCDRAYAVGRSEELSHPDVQRALRTGVLAGYLDTETHQVHEWRGTTGMGYYRLTGAELQARSSIEEYGMDSPALRQLMFDHNVVVTEELKHDIPCAGQSTHGVTELLSATPDMPLDEMHMRTTSALMVRDLAQGRGMVDHSWTARAEALCDQYEGTLRTMEAQNPLPARSQERGGRDE